VGCCDCGGGVVVVTAMDVILEIMRNENGCVMVGVRNLKRTTNESNRT
jgi:hypothetical protein